MSSRAAPPAPATPPTSAPPRSLLRRIARIAVQVALVLALLAVAGVAALRFVIWPQANVSHAWLERELSQRLQIQLTIGQLETFWDGWRPAFRVRTLRGIDAGRRDVLAAGMLEGAVSWRSVSHFTLLFHTLRIDQADVLVRRDKQDQLHVAGVPVSPGPASDNNPALGWLLQQGKLTVHGAKVRWLDEYANQPTLEIGDISLETSRRTLYHKVQLRAHAQPLSPAPISISADFRSALLGSAGDWRTWHGQSSWDVQGLRMAALTRYLPPSLRPATMRSGSLTSSGSAEFNDGTIIRSQLRMRVQDLAMQWRADTDPIHLQSGQAFLVHHGNSKGEHSVVLDHLLWRAAHEEGVPARRTDAATREEQAELLPPRNGLRNVTFGWALGPDQRFRQLSLKASEIDLDAVRNLAIRLPVAPAALDTMRRLQMGGRVENLDLSWRREAGHATEGTRTGLRYSARGALRNVRFDALPQLPGNDPRQAETLRTPGAAGLTGHFEATERGGVATFDSQQLTLTLPGVFDEPQLALDTLQGRLQWQWHGDKLEVRSERMNFANADAAGSVSGAWRSSGKSPAGTLDIKGRLDHAHVQQVPRYLPSAISAHVRHYLTGALLGGEARNVTFVARGDLADFPFHDSKQGEFHVKVPVEGLTYQPAPAELENGQPAWPSFEGGSGQVVFERRGMHFVVERANIVGVSGVSVANVQGQIDDMDAADSALRITGQASGTMQGFIQYVNRSRLGAWSGQLTAQSRATGTGDLALSLDMPLHHVAQTKANGKLRLVNSDLTLLPDLPAFMRTNGAILITERGLTLEGMRTMFAGGELLPTGGTQRDGSTRFEGKGQISARGLQALRGDPLGPLGARLSGSAPYTAAVSFQGGRVAVNVDSTLEGLAIALPAPVGKSAVQAMPLRVELKPGNAGASSPDTLSVQLGQAIQARYELQRAAGNLKVVRGGIGVNQPVPAPASGVYADINLPELDLDAWRDFSATLAETPDDSADNDYMPTRIQLRATAVRMFDRRIDDVAVQATRDRDWRMQIHSRQIEGTAIWNDATPQTPDGKLTLRLKRLLIPQVPEANVVDEAFARRAESLPSLDLVSNTLDIGGKALGKLTIVARSEKQDGHPVWTLDRLALEQAAATFEARGSWRIPRRLRSEPDPERRTILSFTLTMRDAGAMLDRLGMQRMLRGGDGTLEGRLAWQGSPMAIDYPSLTGRLMLDVKDGVLLNVEPGAARLLGILSLQGLARLVTLDFRGVASSGTVFDATTASAEVRNGIATTNDFRMRSPQFTMEMKGSTNIPAETQQLEVTVLPKINATTASLATTFINPAIGLGTLAAQLLFADQVSSAFRQQYRISGSWSAPDIRKVGDNSGSSNTADTSQHSPASN